jgi:hypothetical protein
MVITSGQGCDGGVLMEEASMIRFLLLLLLVIGLGYGLQRGWLRIDWQRMDQDLNLPFQR